MVNYFFWTKVNSPRSGQVVVINIFSLEVVVVLMLMNPCRALFGVIVGTEKDEEKSNFIFLIGYGMSD